MENQEIQNEIYDDTDVDTVIEEIRVALFTDKTLQKYENTLNEKFELLEKRDFKNRSRMGIELWFYESFIELKSLQKQHFKKLKIHRIEKLNFEMVCQVTDCNCLNFRYNTFNQSITYYKKLKTFENFIKNSIKNFLKILKTTQYFYQEFNEKNKFLCQKFFIEYYKWVFIPEEEKKSIPGINYELKNWSVCSIPPWDLESFLFFIEYIKFPNYVKTEADSYIEGEFSYIEDFNFYLLGLKRVYKQMIIKWQKDFDKPKHFFNI